MIHGDDDVRCAHSPHEGCITVHRCGGVHAVAHERSGYAGRGGRVPGAGDVSDVLAQVIAGSFFAMEAGEAWRGGGYGQPVPNAGDMQLAQDILADGRLAIARSSLAADDASARPAVIRTDRQEAITAAYNAVTGADDEGWSPDRALRALNTLWEAAVAFVRGGSHGDAVRNPASSEPGAK